MQKKTADN